MGFDPAKLVAGLFEADGGNRFDDTALGPMFDPPLVAVAAADDPWFARLKQVIGEFHWTPQEALALSGSGTRARSVICWCAPIAAAARQANRGQRSVPSRQWAYVRTFGEQFLTRVRHAVEDRLGGFGFAALAPHESPQNRIHDRPGVGRSACWSERHVAFVAGLGTFGISGGLITPRGVAHRLSSVVTEMELPPTPRPYGDDPFAWCLRSARGTCGECIERCPTTSIGPSVRERNKQACFQWTYEQVRGERGRALFGWDGAYGCGLCQTGVPCEDRNPTES